MSPSSKPCRQANRFGTMNAATYLGSAILRRRTLIKLAGTTTLVFASCSPLAAEKPATNERSLAELHVELRALEKGTSRAKTDQQRTQNILQLCALFVEIGQHPDLPKSPTLQSLSVRLRTRLIGLEKRTVDELKRRRIPEPDDMVAREKRYRQSRARASGVAPRGNSTSRGSLVSGSAVSGSTGDSTGRSVDPTSDSEQQAAGPNSRSGGLAAPGLPDYGWSLVDLIRKTVRPDYWTVSGGPGKAIYFGHARALVIHGSWRVQEDVAQLLNALRGG